MHYRIVLAALAVLALGSCEEDADLPVAPPVTSKAPTTPPSASVRLTRVDTSRASSICRATVRARGRARIALDRTPTDDLARNKAVAFDALVADACK